MANPLNLARDALIAEARCFLGSTPSSAMNEGEALVEALVEALAAVDAEPVLCEDCPRVGHSTDKTRCSPCPRRLDVLDQNLTSLTGRLSKIADGLDYEANLSQNSTPHYEAEDLRNAVDIIIAAKGAAVTFHMLTGSSELDDMAEGEFEALRRARAGLVQFVDVCTPAGAPTPLGRRLRDVLKVRP